MEEVSSDSQTRHNQVIQCIYLRATQLLGQPVQLRTEPTLTRWVLDENTQVLV